MQSHGCLLMIRNRPCQSRCSCEHAPCDDAACGAPHAASRPAHAASTSATGRWPTLFSLACDISGAEKKSRRCGRKERERQQDGREDASPTKGPMDAGRCEDLPGELDGSARAGAPHVVKVGLDGLCRCRCFPAELALTSAVFGATKARLHP